MYKISEKLLVLILIYAGFLVDTINSILMKVENEYNILSLVMRSITEIIFISLLMKHKIFTPLKIIFILIAFSFIGMIITLPNDLNTLGSIGSNLIALNKTLYYFVVLAIIFLYFQEDTKAIFQFFNIAYFFFVCTIFCGVLFHLQIFEAYPQESRFGYKGIIVTPNEAVGIMLIGMFFYFHEYLYSRKMKNFIFIFLILIAGLLTGTKANMFFLLFSFVLFYILLLFKSYKILNSIYIIIPILTIINWDKILEVFQQTINYITSFYYRGYDIWFIILSGRNLRLENMFAQINNNEYSIYNLVFGGYNFSTMGTEMDLFDIFQFFGIIGGVAFYFFYFKSFLLKSKNHGLVYLFIFIWFTVSTLGGHMIYNAVIPIYLSILLLKFNRIAS